MAQSKLIWDVTKPDKITWLRYNAKLIDCAVLRGRKAALVVVVRQHSLPLLDLQLTLDMPLNAVGPRDPQLGLAII